MVAEKLMTAVTQPTPHALWQLRSDLLAGGAAPDAPALVVLSHAFAFFTELSARMTAQGFTELASMLDIGAVGTVALQNLVDGDTAKGEFWQRLLLGALSEGLMVLASRQYIKGAKAEVEALFQNHAWILADLLWRFSQARQPALPNTGRAQTIDRLFAPIWAEPTEPMAKAALIGRLYQMMLLANLQSPISNHPSPDSP